MAKRKGYEKDREIRRRLRETERQLLVQRVYQEEISGQVTLDESDYDLYYQAHKEEFMDPARLGVAHIQLVDEETAADVMKRVENGEKFADLARELSVDSQTREKNGELGELRGGSTYIPGLGDEPQIAEAVAEMEVGAVTGPMQSAKGWHVLTVTRKAPEQQKELEKVKPQIEFELRRMKETGKCFAYLVEKDDGHAEVTTWPGNLISDRVFILRKMRDNFGGERVYFRFIFDGEIWSGFACGFGMYLTAKRTKLKSLRA